MSGHLFLVDRCDTERRGRTEQGYGGKPTYTPNETNLPCRLTSKTQRGFSSITGEWLTTTVYTLHLEYDADVVEGDRVTNVVLQDGTEVGDTFEVDGGSLARRGRMDTIKLVSLKRVS